MPRTCRLPSVSTFCPDSNPAPLRTSTDEIPVAALPWPGFFMLGCRFADCRGEVTCRLTASGSLRLQQNPPQAGVAERVNAAG
jgi:hypothetical protein